MDNTNLQNTIITIEDTRQSKKMIEMKVKVSYMAL